MSLVCLSFEEWWGLVSQISDLRIRLIFLILYSTGCSELELLEIKKTDFDFKRPSLKIADRNVILSSELGNLLDNYLSTDISSDSEYIFSTRQSDRISQKRLQQLIVQTSNKYLKKSIKPMQIRYTHIYHSILKNIPLPAISSQTGLSYQRIAQIMKDIEPLLVHQRRCYSL